MNDEFYIGYLAKAPEGVGRFARMAAVLLVAIVIAVAAAAGAMQERQPPGTFEFGVARAFEGVLMESPVPSLRLIKSTDGGVPAGAHVLLCGFGKQGLPAFARGHGGRTVAFRGSLIHAGGTAMIEMNDEASFRVLGDAPAAPPIARVAGPVTLRGELVDTKCFLGVMRPAVGKCHRACAIRCLSGGVPAAILARGEDGREALVMLAAPKDRELRLDVQWAGRDIEAKGSLEYHDDLPVLRVERAALLAHD